MYLISGEESKTQVVCGVLYFGTESKIEGTMYFISGEESRTSTSLLCIIIWNWMFKLWFVVFFFNIY